MRISLQVATAAVAALDFDSAKVGDAITRVWKGAEYLAEVVAKTMDRIELDVEGLGPELYDRRGFNQLAASKMLRRAGKKDGAELTQRPRLARQRIAADAEKASIAKLKRMHGDNLSTQATHDLTKALAMLEEAKSPAISPGDKQRSRAAAREFAQRKRLPPVSIEQHPLWPALRYRKITKPRPLWLPNNTELTPDGFQFLVPAGDRFVTLMNRADGKFDLQYGNGSEKWQKATVKSAQKASDFFDGVTKKAPAGSSKAKSSAWVIVYNYTNDTILFLKRSDNSNNPGQWNFPGGGVDQQRPIDAAVRELKEESGISVSQHSLIHLATDATGRKESDYYVLLVDHKPKLRLDKNESSKAKWMTIDEAREKKLHNRTAAILNKAIYRRLLAMLVRKNVG